SHCGERLFSPHPLWRLGHQATRYTGSASRRGPLSRGVRARLATRIGVDGLRVPARADHTTLGALAWISTGRVRAGVDRPHLRGDRDCDAESDAGWHGVKARARARHRARDGSHYPPPVPVGVALWALVHLIVNGDLASLILFGSLLVLALGGTAAI